MATIELPPHMGELRFGPDNNLATNASTEWSAWETVGKVDEENSLLHTTSYLLKETLPKGTNVYWSMEIQVKDIKLGDNPKFSYQGSNPDLYAKSRIEGHTAINAWGVFYLSVDYKSDGYKIIRKTDKTEKEGDYCKGMFRLDYMQATIRYRRFRIVKV